MVAAQQGLRVVSNSDLQLRDEQVAELERDSEPSNDPVVLGIVDYIRKEFQHARNNRDTELISDTLLDCLRTYRGIYNPAILREIAKFGGTEVFARMTSVKCRSATALLRDVYLGGERTWELSPTPEPNLPDDIADSIQGLVASEVGNLSQAGQAIEPSVIQQRVRQLKDAAEMASRKEAKKQAKKATDNLEDDLVEGGFYEALSEALDDLAIFPICVVKGPVVKNVEQIKWVNGQIQKTVRPKLTWERVSPFDMHFTAGATNINNTDTFERVRYTRQELAALIGTPGYREDSIREVLERFAQHGLTQWYDATIESERSDLEGRENTQQNTSGYIDGMEFHGYIPGEELLEIGMTEKQVPDKQQMYFCDAWIVDDLLLKVNLNPNPRKRVPYYVTSYQKIPGSLYGEGVVQILSDIQGVMNSTLRALVNNQSIASGPQVVIDLGQLAETTNATDLYAWKKWFVQNDPLTAKGDRKDPIKFWQPDDRAQTLLQTYNEFFKMADEVSAIPRYMAGSGNSGGAGRTASGLAMLMNNSSKVLQNVAANIDEGIIKPNLQQLYDYKMLTSTDDSLRGDESIHVKGVTVAVQKEQDRVRQLEFLQLTGNPIDMQITGMEGRAALLRSISENLGIDHTDIVPDAAAAQGLQPPPEEGAPPTQEQAPGQGGDGQQPHLNTQKARVDGRNTM